jgi:hypothetical protein
MNHLLIIALQVTLQPENHEDLGVKSILIFLLTLTLSAIVYLHRSKEQALREKDEQIMKVIKEHQQDLKEANTDYKTILDKYHQFTQQIREIANAKRGG